MRPAQKLTLWGTLALALLVFAVWACIHGRRMHDYEGGVSYGYGMAILMVFAQAAVRIAVQLWRLWRSVRRFRASSRPSLR